MLYWLVSQRTTAAAGLLEVLGWEGGGEPNVLREFHHFDLVITGVGAASPLVVENKFTAIPDESQLTAYAKKAADCLSDSSSEPRLSPLPHSPCLRPW